MFISVKSYALFNIKMLLKDKIPLLWSIALPVITFFMNYRSVTNEWELAYWWVYIVVCSYVYGVGVYALQLKEYGSLKTIFSINNSPWAFFLGNLLTQIMFSFISVNLLNLIVVILLPLSFLRLFLYSFITIIACLPVAFFSYNLTLIKKMHANTINSIFTMLIFGLFILLNTNIELNKYNPLSILSNVLIEHKNMDVFKYVTFSIFLVFISMYSIVKFEPISNERR
ncbi:hypothetical protein [Enterococcus faecalis]|uniref:hypothetical protein n=1 Tax=Enterococcus TaxID=1350 RepID=UPI00045A60D9|nr:hypothetical protein [Enterococcus faecalis]EKN1382946.1 hypothetical protein [Enterococcus faecalis]KAJ71608.1 hypothetical protein P786_1020 [Enterococcus faecalis MD6]